MLSVLDLASRLVAVESVSQLSNRPIVELISQFCEDAGCAVSHFPYDNGQQVNIVATKGGSDPYFALSGHTDTVGFRERGWSSNPLQLTYVEKDKEGFYYGLGIADMKLALATSIAATASISTRQLRRPIGLYFTAQEEIGCVGAKRLVVADISVASYVIVCEPTEMIVANRHKGYIYFSVTVTRDHDKHHRKTKLWAHSSDDRRCTNVLETILPLVLQELVAIKEHLRTITDMSFDPPYTTMNLGKVRQPEDASKNIIPTTFTLQCDARPIPAIDQRMFLRLVEGRVANAVSRFRSRILGETFSVEVKAVRQPTPCLVSDVDPSFRSALGNPVMEAVPYNTEAKLFNTAGAQVVILGPGSIWSAHHEDEYVSERWLQPDITERYIAVMTAMCGKEQR